MTANPAAINKLKAECRRLGGALVTVKDEVEFSELFAGWDNTPYSEAPFADCHGVNWKTKTIYVVKGEESVNAIIHEMGHCFADPEDPDNADEWAFLGWEICMARRVGGLKAWDKGNAEYGLGGWKFHSRTYWYWKLLTPKAKKALIKERIDACKETKLIKRGVPRAVR